jgi:hypothetical protein
MVFGKKPRTSLWPHPSIGSNSNHYRPKLVGLECTGGRFGPTGELQTSRRLVATSRGSCHHKHCYPKVSENQARPCEFNHTHLDLRSDPHSFQRQSDEEDSLAVVGEQHPPTLPSCCSRRWLCNNVFWISKSCMVFLEQDKRCVRYIRVVDQ